MPRLSLPKVVVAFLTRDARTTSLDLLARVSVLEGIAGVKPGTWMRNVVPEKEIVEVFGPNVGSAWIRTGGLGFTRDLAILPVSTAKMSSPTT
jgi:hypothetical protein